jgi:isoamylase
MLATLLLAQGTPLLCAGNEIGNSQGGNNNAYCQDNPTGWLDWPAADHPLAEYVAALCRLRAAEPLLHGDRWLTASSHAAEGASVAWLTPAGPEMQVNDWHDQGSHAFACVLSNAAPNGAVNSILIAFNPDSEARPFQLPQGNWRLLLDSSATMAVQSSFPAALPLPVPSRALLVLRTIVV